MKFDKAFSVISRINQTLLFLGFVGLFVLALWGITEIYKESHKPRSGEIAVSGKKQGSDNNTILSFGGFHKIRGTDIMMADISERKVKSYETYAQSKNKNIIFIYTKQNKAHLLFPHSNYLIVSSNVVRVASERYVNDEDSPARGLIYEYVKADTNKDTVVDEEDSHAIGLAHVDGTGAVEILNDFDSLLSSEALDDDTLSVIYQKGDKVISAHYSLKNFKLQSTTVITDILALDKHG